MSKSEDTKGKKGKKRSGGFDYSGVLPDGTPITTKEDVELRREMALKMRREGYTFKEIADKFQVCTRTVMEDVKILKRRLIRRIKKHNNNIETGAVLEHWDELLQRADNVFEECDNAKDKINALNVMVKIVKGKTDFMFACGLISKVEEEGGESFVVDGIDIRKLGVSELMSMLEDKARKVEELKRKVRHGA